jgi:hypothetical protein
MAMVLAKLVTTIALAVSSAGTASPALHPRVSFPTPVAFSLTVICNPAWGTVVIPICV